MARIETDPNYSSPTFSRATAGTDIFKKEDVQSVAAALSTHDHSTGKGLAIGGASIPNGTITSAMIADGTIDTADLKDSSVTSAKIADGTIATADLANQAVTNQKLGTDTARLNLLTNGGFEIWQRGAGPWTGGNNTNYDVVTADMWRGSIGSRTASSTVTTAKDTSNQDSGTACLAFTYANANAADVNVQMYQTVTESVAQLRGKTISLSARVKTSVSGVRVALQTGSVGPIFSA